MCPLVVRLKRFYEFSIRLGEYVRVVFILCVTELCYVTEFEKEAGRASSVT